MTPAEVLRKAADLIEERGWIRGDDALETWANGGPLCAGTAMMEVDRYFTAKDTDPVFRAGWAFREAVGYSCVPVWNDAQPNGEVVIAKLREVADELERAS
jgi:hypothetical protein